MKQSEKVAKKLGIPSDKYKISKIKYKQKIKASFQHGGISMEEMMVPIFIMDPK